MKNFFNRKIITTSVIIAFMFMLGFTPPTPSLAAGPATVNLDSAGNFAILAKTGISTTGTTSVVGDIGVSPAEATYITGFGLILPADGAFSTSSLIAGKVYAPSYAVPTPSYISTAVSNMETAYTDAMGRAANVTELGAGNIGGLTLVPNVYKWGTDVTIPTDVTLSGSANDVWIFQIAQNLDISSATRIILSGGAKASNIFWVVAGQTTIGTTATFNGNILDQTAIVLNTGAILNGRALAQSAVTLDASSVTIPSGVNTNTDTNTNTNTNTDTNSNSNNNVDNSNSNPVFVGLLCPNGKTATSNCQLPPTASEVAVAHVTYNFGTKTLKNGSRGDAVMELQKFLNAKLSLGLVVDGKLGPKTIAVVKKWQNDNNLVVDGLVGSKTKAKMNALAQ